MRVQATDGALEVHVPLGAPDDGPLVILLASLGRPAADFHLLAPVLADAGYRPAAIEPRGVGGSAAAQEPRTLHHLAADVAAVINALGGSPATLVGHAYGNRIARMTATEHPELVESLVLLACGGLVPPTEDVTDALRSVFDKRLDPQTRLAGVQRAFFAPGNDGAVWLDGWHARTAQDQEAASVVTPLQDWWAGGAAEMLVVQPADDVLAVPENAARIAEAFGDRVETAVVADAGHALLPEQPEEVARLVLDWLNRRWGRPVTT